MTEASRTSPERPDEGGALMAAVDDDVLGAFVRTSQTLPGGTRLDAPHFTASHRIGDRTVVLLLDTTDEARARRLLPRMRRAVADGALLRARAVEAVVHEFSETPPTRRELTDAHADLLLDTVVVDGASEVVLHLDDSCGEHIMEGYWPAVRFDTDNQVTDVTIEA
ncbi:hypothetical protein [Streptomyces sp. NBC_00525]|uniref:hypothetical protein n=1 Tax=Streptomyces sp. NBC_00525 TaxID=2903660 RepID=UPI002E81EF05|nr:hypothetical protein [Streptomyces sp. NBC_00525]WUC92235.1 hypothetical protein OG710_00830 [Streptomyces sp. NBC_00525]